MSRNWFDSGGAAYARFRPDYPEALIDYLSALAHPHRWVLDVGCGTGQLTAGLAMRAHEVLGVDPSAAQLTSARRHPGVRYACAAAEALPLGTGQVGLVTAAQAAHWFDLPAFYAEVRRVAAPGAVLALITYGRQILDEETDERFQQFYQAEIGPFWPPERRMVDNGYRELEFPFEGLPVPAFEIQKQLDLAGLLGYVSTWSSVRRAADAGRIELLHRFAEDLSALWGDPHRQRRTRWPVRLRVGRIG